MPRKKPVELVQEDESPKALIINGRQISSFLAKILKDRGCDVTSVESYSSLSGRPALPAISAARQAGRFDYIFLFDNQEVAEEIYEKNLNKNGKFILIETAEEILRPSDLATRTAKESPPKYKILKIGDPSFWSTPELAEKILQTLFSSPEAIVDHRRRPSVSVPKIKKIPHREVEIKSAIRPPLVERKQRFSATKILATLFLIFFLTIFALASLTFWYAGQLKKTFAEIEYHLKSGNLQVLATDIKTVGQKTKTIKGIYNFSSNIFFPLTNTPLFQDVGVILDTSENVMAESEDFIQAVAAIQRSEAFTAVSGLNSEKLASLEKSLADIIFSLVEAQKKLDKVSLPYFPKEKINAFLSPLISQLSGAYEVMSPLEKIFFQEGTKVYLVLFQNNMELRPTGGFIGSFGLLTVDNGKIADFKIQDVYEADGQLKGHVDPPAPIRKYLGQPHFFLRDSNFDPDFAASAVQASFFLQKELGKNVDGVIGVNLSLAQKLMHVVGPIKLADFGNEEIESSNFFFKVHYFSQSNFFPGSTQKKDILTAIANEIMAKLGNDTKINYLELLSLLRRSLEEKNILFYFADEDLQKVVEQGGWAGRMVAVSCIARKEGKAQQTTGSPDNCLPDYLSIIEANLGVNKANYSISKSTVVEKKISSEGKINTTITVSYENEENTILNQKDTYVNYLRFFVPARVKLVSLTLNNAPINPLDIDTENYADDKTVFGFLVSIAPGNKGVVKITYTLPRSFSNDLESYQLFYQKQAGDKNSPLLFSLSYPDGYKLTPVNFSSSTQRDNEIFYTTDTSVDRVFAVRKE